MCPMAYAGIVARPCESPNYSVVTSVVTPMPHPTELMRAVFAVLAATIVIAGLTTRARPETRREWALVWTVLVFLMWALLGFGFVGAVEERHSAALDGNPQCGHCGGGQLRSSEMPATRRITRTGYRHR